MDKHDFDLLLQSVKEMKAHMAGEAVPGIRISEVNAPPVVSIRQAAKLTQAEFANLIGISLRTLQNWEQSRTQPTGSAQALLKIVAHNPGLALAALHAN
jgi:putative transcriptional regulator